MLGLDSFINNGDMIQITEDEYLSCLCVCECLRVAVRRWGSRKMGVAVVRAVTINGYCDDKVLDRSPSPPGLFISPPWVAKINKLNG